MFLRAKTMVLAWLLLHLHGNFAEWCLLEVRSHLSPDHFFGPNMLTPFPHSPAPFYPLSVLHMPDIPALVGAAPIASSGGKLGFQPTLQTCMPLQNAFRTFVTTYAHGTCSLLKLLGTGTSSMVAIAILSFTFVCSHV